MRMAKINKQTIKERNLSFTYRQGSVSYNTPISRRHDHSFPEGIISGRREKWERELFYDFKILQTVVILAQAFHYPGYQRSFFSRATKSFVGRRPTRLRTKAEDTSETAHEKPLAPRVAFHITHQYFFKFAASVTRRGHFPDRIQR